MKTASHNLILTNKDKILFPESGITKKDVLDYYERISGHLLPYAKDRPLTMERFPNGISQKGFFQKNASDYFPDWIETIKIKKVGGWVNHVVCNSKETLLYLANQYVLSFHVALSTLKTVYHPDKLIFDLDPPQGNFNLACKAAYALRSFLEQELDLSTFVMTTGSRGLHVVVPLKGKEHFDEVHEFAKDIALYIANNNPQEFTTLLKKEQRQGRLYIDYLRNSYAQTSIAPFSIRARENAPVATPLHWEELEDRSIHATTYTIQTIFKRLEEMEDPWIAFKESAQSIQAAKKKLEALSP